MVLGHGGGEGTKSVCTAVAWSWKTEKEENQNVFSLLCSSLRLGVVSSTCVGDLPRHLFEVLGVFPRPVRDFGWPLSPGLTRTRCAVSLAFANRTHNTQRSFGPHPHPPSPRKKWYPITGVYRGQIPKKNHWGIIFGPKMMIVQGARL